MDVFVGAEVAPVSAAFGDAVTGASVVCGADGTPVLGDPVLGEPVLGEPVLGEPVLGETVLGETVIGDMLVGTAEGARVKEGL